MEVVSTISASGETFNPLYGGYLAIGKSCEAVQWQLGCLGDRRRREAGNADMASYA